MYLHETDLDLLLDHLDSDDEIAWLVEDGPGHWSAKAQHPPLSRPRYALWHVPSGPLPLDRGPDVEKGTIENPWEGWQEVRRAGSGVRTPYFGPNHAGVYWLNLLMPVFRPTQTDIGMSSFEWSGNRDAIFGKPAAKATELHWRRLRRWVAKNARRVPRFGDINGPRAEIFAFPAALHAMECGASRAGNPF
jgi:hypothetical protein